MDTEKVNLEVPQSVQDFDQYFNSVKSALPASLAAEISNRFGKVSSEYTELTNATDGDLVEEVKQLRATNQKLEAEVGTLDEGQHEDERNPRAATWLEERKNHLAEAKQLQDHITSIESVNADLVKKNDQLFSEVNSLSQKNEALEKLLASQDRQPSKAPE
jgi:cell division protein FtsB